jgi:hypothetical protein
LAHWPHRAEDNTLAHQRPDGTCPPPEKIAGQVVGEFAWPAFAGAPATPDNANCHFRLVIPVEPQYC